MKKFLMYGKQLMLASLFCTGMMLTACDKDDDPKPDPSSSTPTIEVAETTNGSIKVSDVKEYGDAVTITVTPAEGYELEKLVVNDEDVTSKVSEGVYKINQLADDLEISATFKATGTTDAKPEPAAELTYKNVKVVTYTGQWAAPTVAIDASWKTLTYVFVENPENVQFCVVSDAVKSEESWGKAYYSVYPALNAESTTSVLNLAEILEELKALSPEVTKITSVNLQFTAATADENSIAKVKAVIATKEDDTQELVEMSPDWGSSIADGDALTSGDDNGGNGGSTSSKLTYDKVQVVTYTGQWAAPTVTIDASWKKLTYEFVENPANVQFCVVSDAVKSEESWGKAYYSVYPALNSESTTSELDLDALLTELKDLSAEATKITSVNLQFTAATADENSIAKVKAVVATKEDGTKELVKMAGDWGSSIADGDPIE